MGSATVAKGRTTLAMAADWQEDMLGAEFESTVLQVPAVDGAPQRATLVRYLPQSPQRSPGGHAVLYVHGWSDYFFNTELAGFWHRQGVAFYALDLHHHGRSLQEGEPAGFVTDLRQYDDEISLALELIGEETGGSETNITLMGHSTGGLVASLWAAEHPGRLRALVLNSPWLEMHGSSLVRRAAGAVLEPLARMKPEAEIKLPVRGFYYRSISRTAEGEWDLDPRLRPPESFPVRAGWLSAIWDGQAKVAKGLDLEIPVLVMSSTRSMNGPVWHEDMKNTDVVLDIRTMTERAVRLGSSVTIEQVQDAVHDVFLSRSDVRDDAYARLQRWAQAYMLGTSERPALPPQTA
ncbi:alpha/beta hydrolase [Arthrobacter sp. CAU 1506]|uniref:alpha/beta hydrolase n=1 Tax=Arthrobacter sp. CAU 1506 TaxID=2560052 RepID=UPI001F0EE900|nr:alpha/beta hydrolase [Arthrobacter sp. CAU 1506]